MTHTTAAEKVKEIIRSYLEFYTERGSMTTVKEWLESKEGSRLVGELVEGWVSVKDRLPDYDQIVDTWNGLSNRRAKYYRVGHPDNPINFYRHVDSTEGDRTMNLYYPDVTHWQPLPEPPKIN